MTWKEILRMNVGASVMHKRYGECTIKEVIDELGVVLLPKTKDGQKLLVDDFGVISPTLEDNIRNIKHLGDNR